MGVHIPVPRTKYEAASKLKGVSAEAVLRVSCCMGASSRLDVITPEQMQKAAGLKLCRPISNSLLIQQQGKVDASLFPKETGVTQIAQTYSGKLSPRITEIALIRAQLRDVLPAEDSPIVTKKNKNCWALLPKRAELYFASARIR